MREGIHPNYVEATISCACGNSFKTRSVKQEIRLEICSNCHPFFTGRQKFVDTAGRVERFQKRFSKTAGEAAPKPVAKQPKLAKGQQTTMPKKAPVKVLSSAPLKVNKPAPGKAAPKAGDKEKAPAKPA